MHYQGPPKSGDKDGRAADDAGAGKHDNISTSCVIKRFDLNECSENRPQHDMSSQHGICAEHSRPESQEL